MALEVMQGVYRGWSDLAVLDELAVPISCHDFSPEKPRALWANYAYLSLFGMSLREFQMSHQRNKEEGEEDRENRERVRQMLYEKVQVNKEEHEERRTEHPQGKEFSSTWRCRPIRVIHEKSRKENVQALIVYMPDHEAAKEAELDASMARRVEEAEEKGRRGREEAERKREEAEEEVRRRRLLLQHKVKELELFKGWKSPVGTPLLSPAYKLSPVTLLPPPSHSQMSPMTRPTSSGGSQIGDSTPLGTSLGTMRVPPMSTAPSTESQGRQVSTTDRKSVV